MHQSQLALEFTVNFTPLSFAPLSSSPNSTSTTAALLAAALSNHHSASSNTTKQYQNQPFNHHNQTNMPNTTFLNALRHDAESSLGFAPSSSPTKERSDSISSLHVISDSEDSDVSSSSADLEKLVRSIPRKPRLIRSRSASSPFWFGTEDSDHIRNIWQRYTDHFKIALNRPKNSRRPVEFIGCIRRTQLTPLSSTSDAPFQTLDEITVFQRDILPLGCPLPKQEVLYSVVTWDNEDGLPTNFGDKLTSAKYHRRLEQLSEHPVSYFYCLPIFNLDHEYVFFNELTPRHQVSFFAPASPEMSLASDLRSVAKNSLSGGDGDDMSPWTPPKSAPTLGTLSGSSVTAACLALPISLSGSESMCMFPMDFDSPQVGGSGGGPRFSAMVFTTSSSGSGVNDDDDADNCGFMFSSGGDDDVEVDLEEIPDDEEEEEEEQADDDDDVDYQHEAEDEYEAEATGFDFSGPPASSSFSRSSSISITIQKRPASGAVEKDQQQKMSRSFEEDLANLMSSVGGGGARGGAKKSTMFTATFQFFDE